MPTITIEATSSADNLALPIICIPHVKMTIGRGEFERPMTSQFIQDAFSRYGEIGDVAMKICSSHNSETDYIYGGTTGRGNVAQYYHVCVHFKRWRIENGEARYVRSVLLSPNTMANIKLSYDGPWYWKFYASHTNTTSARRYSYQSKIDLQLD